MKRRTYFRVLTCLTPILFLAGPYCDAAQQESDPSSQQQQAPQPSAGDAGSPALTPSPAYPVDAEIHAAGKAVPWIGDGSPLRYGPFSVGSIDLIGVHDEFLPSDNSQVQQNRLGILRANVNFALAFRKSVFVLQYTPQLAMLNGQVRGGADGSGDLSLGQVFNFSPRTSLAVKNDFGYAHTRQIFPDQFLLVDKQNGGVVQSYFLENSGTHLQNTFNIVLNHRITPRLLLSIAPSYLYSDTHFVTGSYIVNDSKNTVSVTYGLSPRRNIGFLQSVEVLIPVRPVSSKGYFLASELFYSEQVTKTWWIVGRVGAESATYPGFNETTWATAGSFSLVKAFSNGEFALAYTRGSTLTNFATNRQLEQADATCGLRLLRNLKWTNGIGNFREVGADPVTTGRYWISTLEYRLPWNFSLLSSYTRRNQSSSTTQLISGNRNTIFFGVRWAPPPPPVGQ